MRKQADDFSQLCCGCESSKDNNRSNCKPTHGGMSNRHKCSRPCAAPNVKLLLIFKISIRQLRETRKSLATEIHAQALCTGQRNPQKRLELSVLHRQKLLKTH